MPTIDADAHVLETERTWDYMEESDRELRPRVVSSDEGGDDIAYVFKYTGKIISSSVQTMNMRIRPARLKLYEN